MPLALEVPLTKLSRKKNILPVLLILLTAILAFWQVFFLQHGLKWDVIDSFLPARYFVGESLRNGTIPLWNPYLLLGTPSYGDMVSVWNPEVWIVSLFTSYSNITLQFIYVAYVFIAGWGMFKLLTHFKVVRSFALAGGIAYMLSGFMVGNAQNLSAIAGAAWLPFVVLYYWRFLQDIRWQTLFPVLFFLYLMVFNGYPGLTIILGYLLLSFFVVELIVKIRKKERWLRFLKFHLFLGLLVSAISIVLIISFFQVSPFIGQYGGGSLKWAEMHPFSPRSLITFLLPLSGVKSSEFFATDISMTNGYVGILTLIFFIVSLFLKKSRFLWVITLFGLFSLLASFGEFMPVRGWFFHYLPLMNVFRYPAFFRLFVIFAIVFSAFYYLELLLAKKQKLLLAGTLVVTGILFYDAVTHFSAVYFGKLNLFDFVIPFTERLAQLSFNDSIFFQSVFQIGFIGLSLILWLLLRKKPARNWVLSVLIVADLLIATQINSSFTVYGNKNPAELAENLSELPMGYPLPTEREVVYNTEQSGEFLPVWRNTNLFHKRVSPYGFGSFFLNDFVAFTDSFPAFSKKVFHHPTAYFSSELLPENKMNDTCKDKNALFVDPSVYKEYHKLFTGQNIAQDNKILWQKFTPNYFKLTTKTTSPQVLVLMQNYFPYWYATIDGKPAKTFSVNKTLLSVFLPKGNHSIAFRFSPPLVKFGFYLGMFILLGLLIFFVFRFYPETLPKYRKQILFVLVLLLIFSVRGKIDDQNRRYGNYKIMNLAIQHLQAKFADNPITGVIDVNDSQKIKMPIGSNTGIQFISLGDKQNWNQLALLLDTTQSDYFFYGTSHKPFFHEIITEIREKFPEIIYQIDARDIHFYGFSKRVRKDPDIVVSSWNFMEGNPDGWNNYPKKITNTKAFSWQKSCIVSKEDPYSVLYKKLNTSQLDSGKTYSITMLARVFLPDDANGGLVCSISAKDTNLLWKSQDLNPFFEKRNQWTLVGKTIILKNNFPPDLPVKVYFWNKNKIPFYIDNMHLEVRKIEK